MFTRINYGPDDVGSGSASIADTGASTEELGQAVTAPADAGQAASEYFLELQDEKGSKKAYKTREEFLSDWKNMGMMRSDYTRKTSEIARMRQEHDQKVAEFNRKMKEEGSKYEKYNQFLKSNPHVYRQLEEALRKGMSPNDATEAAKGYADEKYAELQKKLDELDGWKKNREQEESKRKLYDSFKSKYEDFDESSIEGALKVLAEGDSEAILDLLYHSIKGRSAPDKFQMEREFADKLQAKGAARVLPGSGPKPSAPQVFASLDEAEKAALRGAKS